MAFVFDELEDEFKNDCVFVVSDVTAIIKEAIDEALKNKTYDEKLVKQDTNDVLQNIVNGLMKMEKPFKYIVTCVILPKFGTGIHTGNICHWDEEHDRVLTIPWENEHLHVIVTVFGIGFFQSKIPIIDNIVGKFKRQGDRLIPFSKSRHPSIK